MLKFDVDVPTPYETDEYNRDLSLPEIDTPPISWALCGMR